MRTFDAQGSGTPSLLARTTRNVKILLRIARMVKAYLTTGATIRRNYREKLRRGEIYYVDSP